tara:strand:+ start:785 stop:967 length:183 start_codon:yes stop_codon:yes gene_type:complete
MSRYKIHESILSEIDNLPTNDWLDTEVGSDISLSDSTKVNGECRDCGETIADCSGYKCWI